MPKKGAWTEERRARFRETIAKKKLLRERFGAHGMAQKIADAVMEPPVRSAGQATSVPKFLRALADLLEARDA